MKAIEINELELDRAIDEGDNGSPKRTSEIPSIFGDGRKVPSPDWAQYAATLANTVTRTRRASRGII